MLKLNNTGIGGAKNNRQKSGRKFIYYNSTYAYLLLSSHSMLSQQLLNVATKSVLTPKQRELNSTQVQLKTADILNHVNGVRRQNYGELKNTGSDTSINVFTNLACNGSQERLNTNG